MGTDKITMLNEEFENEQTGEKVPGITIIIDGKLKQIMDILIARNEEYNSYTEIMRDALFNGLGQIMQNTK